MDPLNLLDPVDLLNSRLERFNGIGAFNCPTDPLDPPNPVEQLEPVDKLDPVEPRSSESDGSIYSIESSECTGSFHISGSTELFDIQRFDTVATFQWILWIIHGSIGYPFDIHRVDPLYPVDHCISTGYNNMF